MDIYQIIITYYPIWSPFEWIIFLSVLALAVCIAVVLYKKQKITMRQSIAGILLLLYLLLVFGSTVFTRMPGERQYQLEAFWSWKKILHYIEQHGMVTGTGLSGRNVTSICVWQQRQNQVVAWFAVWYFYFRMHRRVTVDSVPGII